MSCDHDIDEYCVKRDNLRELPPDSGKLVPLTIARGICNEELLRHVHVIGVRMDCASVNPSGTAATIARQLLAEPLTLALELVARHIDLALVESTDVPRQTPPI